MNLALKSTSYRVRRKLARTGRQLLKRLSPEERAFALAWPLIDVVPGFMVSPWQERWLFSTARGLPDDATIVEIGSFKGRSTVALALGCENSNKRIFAIDPFDGSGIVAREPDGDLLSEFKRNIDSAGIADRVTAIRGFSHDVSDSWESEIDLLFIDGSHEYDHVRADFFDYFPHVREGGVVAFHDVPTDEDGPDTIWDDVRRVWLEVKPQLVATGRVKSLTFGRKPHARNLATRSNKTPPSPDVRPTTRTGH